jgi:DNA polymerase I-like protein with 3'-5' exonuclease and polymerase domains
MENNMTALDFFGNNIAILSFKLESKTITQEEFNIKLYNLFQQAKQMEKQQKIAYKISTPLGHVAHCIEKYGIEIAISEYKCKLVNNKESNFWNDCLKIAKLYNEKFNKNEK